MHFDVGFYVPFFLRNLRILTYSYLKSDFIYGCFLAGLHSRHIISTKQVGYAISFEKLFPQVHCI